MTTPIDYAALSPVPLEKYSPAETLVDGNPLQVVLSYFEAAGGRFKTGIWSGEKGAYRLEFGPTKHEFFIVTEGHVRVTPDGGEASDYRAGEACVIPAGFQGVFAIIENARKYYAIGE